MAQSRSGIRDSNTFFYTGEAHGRVANDTVVNANRAVVEEISQSIA